MNKATIIFKYGIQFSDNISRDEADYLAREWSVFLKTGKPRATQGGITFNGMNRCLVFNPNEVMGIMFE